MNKFKSKVFYSLIGIIVIFLIVLAVNLLVSPMNVRGDLTEENLYTLSPNTKKILGKLDSPVIIKFYYSKSKNIPPFLKSYATKVADILSEYKRYGNGKVEIEKFDPSPESDAEDSAVMDGINGQMMSNGDKFYLGLCVSALDQRVALPFLSPSREDMLEYDITRAITQVIKVKKSVVGVMSALPVMGTKQNNIMLQMNRMPQQGAMWVAFKELKKDFEVRDLPMESESIPEDLDLLVVVHPAGISDKTQFAIDQYVLKGGKMLAFVDPYSFYAANISQKNQQQQMMMMQPPNSSSTMEKLFKAWGVEFDTGKVVSDMTCARRFKTQERSLTIPTIIDLTGKCVNKDEIYTAQLENIGEVLAGALSGTPPEGLAKTTLFHSTKDSQMVNNFLGSNFEMAAKDFKSEDKEQILAIKLAGKFKTAFPEGKPVDKDDKDAKKDEKKDDKDAKKDDSLKESKKDSIVIIVADTDMLFDDFCVKTGNLFGQTLMAPLNDNLAFFNNTVEYLCGDSDLIGIRSKRVVSRPFTRVREIQSKAEQKYITQIQALESELQKTQQRLNDMQRQKSQNQRFILSPEQQQEIKKFKETEASAKKELKTLRKQLRREIDSLEAKVKWVNIALIPALIALFGICLAVYKHSRS
jgi:ABC-type uncharacterized transport system involved in gliding motility auxiliary subunit